MGKIKLIKKSEIKLSSTLAGNIINSPKQREWFVNRTTEVSN
jgi:hypothetical protein|tara:strand:- start:28591 stop:28716 length:126 start_codon:yes stop_codon:yes gene_type:complete